MDASIAIAPVFKRFQNVVITSGVMELFIGCSVAFKEITVKTEVNL